MIKTAITGIGDHQILVWENKYYCYATSHSEGFHCRKSEDLINWS